MAVLFACIVAFAAVAPAGAQAPAGADASLPLTQKEPFPLYRYTLSNGLSLWVQPRDDSPSVVALLVIRAGARYEDRSNSGISHFVEHMVFTGTERWTEEELKQIITRQGGRYNGWTGKERTTYLAHVAAEDLDLALLWLAEVVFHPAFPADKVDKERQVVFQERQGHYGWLINTLDSLGLGYELERAVQVALFPDSGLAARTVGEDRSLDRLDRQALVRYYEQYYMPNNATLILVGNVLPEHALARTELRFGDLEPGDLPPAPRSPALPGGGPLRITVRGPLITDQVRLIAGARTVGRFDADRWALEVLGVLLDGALTREIRYRRGLVYGLSASNVFYDDAGYLAIATTAESGSEEVIREQAEAYLDRVARGEVGAGSVAAARTALSGRWALSMEDSLARAKWLAEWSFVLPAREPVPDYQARINAVQAEDLVRVVSTYLAPERRFLGLHLPVITLKGGGEAAVLGLGLFAAVRLVRHIVARRRRAVAGGSPGLEQAKPQAWPG